MIKINLAKGFAGASKGSADTGFSEEADLGDIKKEGAKRALMILMMPALLYLYSDYFLIPDLGSQLKMRQRYLSELQEKNNRAAGAVEEIKKFKEDQRKIQLQIEKVEKLQKMRLREVKILDTLQRDMPEKAWLLEVEIEGDRLNIRGRATSDSEITALMDNLQRSIFFKTVNLIKSVEERTDKGLLKGFEIRCDLEESSLSLSRGGV